jgi:hypothetical protein
LPPTAEAAAGPGVSVRHNAAFRERHVFVQTSLRGVITHCTRRSFAFTIAANAFIRPTLR